MAWFFFGLSSLLAFYFLLGYPILLRLLPFRPRPVRKDPKHTPSVTVLMAVHNGEQFLAAKIDSLLGLDYPPELLRILILDDASTDSTAVLGRTLAASHPGRSIECVTLPKGGKSAALNHGLSMAKSELLFFTDVRQHLDPQALRHLAACFADPSVGAVTGELRFFESTTTTGEQATMDLYWRYELWVRERHSLRDSLFNTTGCIYAMRRDLARPIAPDTLTDDAVLPLQAYFSGQRIVFDPEAIAYDYPHRAGGEWGRRMRTLAGMWQTYVRLPRLFYDPRRMWFHFLSHKFGRLLLPWLLLLNLGSTFFLPQGPFRLFLLSGSVLLVALALSDSFLPAGNPLRRLTSRAKTFLSMNLAALASLQVFFRDPRSLWSPSQISSGKTP